MKTPRIVSIVAAVVFAALVVLSCSPLMDSVRADADKTVPVALSVDAAGSSFADTGRSYRVVVSAPDISEDIIWDTLLPGAHTFDIPVGLDRTFCVMRYQDGVLVDSGSYTQDISYRSNGSAVKVEVVILPVAPTIVSEIFDTAVYTGGSAQFRMVVKGTLPTYAWYKKGSTVSITNAPMLVLSNATFADSGTYFCIVSTSGGSDTSHDAHLKVKTPSVVDMTKPVVTLNGPEETSYAAGATYDELGATAIDETDGAVDVVIDTMNLDMTTPATYTIRYTAEDLSHNVGIAYRRVVVSTPGKCPLVTIAAPTDSCGSILREPDSVEYDSSASVTLTARPEVGYRFDGWSGDVDTSEIADTQVVITEMGGKRTITATFSHIIPTYQLVVKAEPDSCGVVTTDKPSGVYDSLATALVSVQQNSGFVFSGWKNHPGLPLTLPLQYRVLKNDTLVAQFQKVLEGSLTIGVSSLHGRVIQSPPKSTYVKGDTVGLKAVPDTCYRFVRWIGDVSGSADSIPVVLDTSISVAALFEADTLDAPVISTATGVTPRSIRVTWSKVPRAVKYRLLMQTAAKVDTLYLGTDSAWTVDNLALRSTHLFKVQAIDYIGTATAFSDTVRGEPRAPTRFTLKLGSLPAGGRVYANDTLLTVAGRFFDSSSVVTLRAENDAGYRFAGWVNNYGSSAVFDTSRSISVRMDSALSISAQFVQVRKLVVQLGLGASSHSFSLTAGSKTVVPRWGDTLFFDNGASVDLSITPDGNYLPEPGNAGSPVSPNTWRIDMVLDTLVLVNFRPVYTLGALVNFSGAGNVVASKTSPYVAGDAVSLTATANAGWKFVRWSGADTSLVVNGSQTTASNPLSFSMPSGDVMLKAEFSWAGTEDLVSVVWTGTRYVAAGADGALISSIDGVIWGSVYTAAQQDSLVGKIRYTRIQQASHGVVVALGYYNQSKMMVVESGDSGKVFTVREPGSSYTAVPRGLVFTWDAGLYYYVVGDSGTIIESPNIVSAFYPVAPIVTRNLKDIIWTGSHLVAVGDSVVLTSPDGQTWTDITASMPGSFLTSLVAGAYMDGTTPVIACSNGYLFTSGNGGTSFIVANSQPSLNGKTITSLEGSSRYFCGTNGLFGYFDVVPGPANFVSTTYTEGNLPDFNAVANLVCVANGGGIYQIDPNTNKVYKR